MKLIDRLKKIFERKDDVDIDREWRQKWTHNNELAKSVMIDFGNGKEPVSLAWVRGWGSWDFGTLEKMREAEDRLKADPRFIA